MGRIILIGILFIFIFSNLAVAETEKTKKKIELEEIIVTATKTEEKIEDVPASVNVITEREIELKQPKTIDEVINDIPGVYVKRGKGLMDTLSRITLRGFPYQQRTLILIDGIPLNGPYYGGVKFGGFYPENLKKVEVVKGPFSSLYGGYAMGGVVNFITKMPEKTEFIWKMGYGSSFNRGDAMDDMRRIYAAYGNKVKNLSFFVSYGRQETNGYPTTFVTTSSVPSGTTGAIPSYYIKYGKVYEGYITGDTGDNTWWDDGITVKAQYEFTEDTKLRFTFMRNRYEYDYTKPHTYLYNTTTGEPIYYPSEKSYIGTPGGRLQNIYGLIGQTDLFEKIKVKLNLSYVDIRKDWYILPQRGATFSGGPGKFSYTKANAFTADLQFILPIFNNQILTFGGYYRREYANVKEKNLSNWADEDSTISLRYEAKGKTRTYAFYVQDEIILFDNLRIFLGFREDFWRAYDGYANQIGTTGYPKEYKSHSESCFSPKFGIVFKPFKKTTLRASIGKAFRPPTVYELYRTWTSSYGTVYAGNPELDPEKTTSWDAGIEQKLWKGAKFSFTYFENYMKDLIYSVYTQPKYKEKVNVGKAESKGVEIGFIQKFDNWLRFFINLTYTHSEVTKNPEKPEIVGKRLIHVPLWMGNIGLEVKRGKIFAYIVGRYVDKVYSDDENRDKKSNVPCSYDEYFVVDLAASYTINKYAKVNLSIDNLFDRDYYQYYKAPGSSWFVELTLKF